MFCSNWHGEAGTNISDVTRQFDVHKKTSYRIINRFWQTRLAENRPGLSRRDRLLSAIPPCWTPINCLWYASISRNRPKPFPMHVKMVVKMMVKILIFLPFENLSMTGTALHTNGISKRCILAFILNKIVIAFTAKNILLKRTWKVIYLWKRQPYFILANFFLKQGINSDHVMVDLICLG